MKKKASKKKAKKSKKKAASAPKRAASKKKAARARGEPMALAKAARGGRAIGRAAPGAAASLFPPEEIERLRMVALTSARREDKIEALRRIAFSPLVLEEKADLFLGRLADADPDIRIEAAQLLRGLGLDAEIAEAIRELEHGDEDQKLFAIDRMGRRMASGGPLDAGAGLIALVGRLREERAPSVRKQLLGRLEDAASVIARAPARAEELVRLLVTLFASDPINTGPHARRLVARLGAKLPDELRRVLWSECDATSSGHVITFVLQLLSGLPDSRDDERLPAAIGEQIAQAKEGDPGYRALGDQLMQMGDAGVEALLAVFSGAKPAQQQYIVRLVADTARFAAISPSVKNRIAELFASLFAGHQREVQMCVMQTQLLTDRDLTDDTRRRLADSYLSHIHLFGFPSDIENVEHTVSRAGLAAVEPLLERLGPRSAGEDRGRAARVLGELARFEGASSKAGTEMRGPLLDILRALQRWSLESDFPDKMAVFTAMGKVVSAPAVPVETVELVARNLLERRDAEDLGHRVLEALGYLATSPHVSADRVDQIEGLFRAQLEADLPEIATHESEDEGVSVFSIGQEAEMYTDAIPAAARGLAHVALGRNAGAARVDSLTRFLLALWERVAVGELQWGPPGAGALVSALKDIACGERVNVALKIAIVKSFAKKMHQVPPLEALGAIFASEDRSVDLGRLAAAAGVAILRRRVDGRFEEEEREHCLKVLASIIDRSSLDTSTDLTKHLREDVVEELFSGVRDAVPGCYELLARLRASAKLPHAFRDGVSRRLAAYESLVPV